MNIAENVIKLLGFEPDLEGVMPMKCQIVVSLLNFREACQCHLR
jgi:hypothetical protein